LNSKEGVRLSRRFHLVLQAEVEDELSRYASSHGISKAEALRFLAVRGLAVEDVEGGGKRVETPGTLAALVAAELSVLMVASVLPEGQQRASDLAAKAAEAAEARLALFREADR
jgi:hypothetical protein